MATNPADTRRARARLERFKLLGEGVPNWADMGIVTRFCGTLLAVGFVLLLVHSLFVAGLAFAGPVLWALALTAGGMGAGFLFGIPKVLQGKPEVSPPQHEAAGSDGKPAASSAAGAGAYQQRVNTNLEEISDWLTKIIVGLGLVELKQAPGYLRTLSSHIGVSFGEADHHSVGAAILVFFATLGFLYGYLMTRIYLQGALARAEGERFAMLEEKLQKTDQKANAALATVAEDAVQRKNKPSAEASAAGDLWQSDPHKGLAAGRSEANGRKVTATVVPIRGGEQANRVHLEVFSTDPARPLTSPVTFLLHPTFPASRRQVAPDKDGVARLDFVAAGVFTAGVEADGGATKLEIDLSRVPGGTDEFYNN
jgi:hypothetical protein